MNRFQACPLVSHPIREDDSVAVAGSAVEVGEDGLGHGYQRVIASRDWHLVSEIVAVDSLSSYTETESCEGGGLFAVVRSVRGNLRAMRCHCATHVRDSVNLDHPAVVHVATLSQSWRGRTDTVTWQAGWIRVRGPWTLIPSLVVLQVLASIVPLHEIASGAATCH